MVKYPKCSYQFNNYGRKVTTREEVDKKLDSMVRWWFIKRLYINFLIFKSRIKVKIEYYLRGRSSF